MIQLGKRRSRRGRTRQRTTAGSSLESNLYFWLVLSIVFLTVFLTAVTSYYSLQEVIEDAHVYSDQLLKAADSHLNIRLHELEEFAVLNAEALREQQAGSVPPHEFPSGHYVPEGVEFLAMSEHPAENWTLQYSQQIQGSSTTLAARALSAGSPLVRELARQFSVGNIHGGWGRPFSLASRNWLLPYGVRVSENRLFVLLMSLEELGSELMVLDFLEEVSTFLALTGQTQEPAAGTNARPRSSDYLKLIDGAELARGQSLHWWTLLSGKSSLVSYRPQSLLANVYLGLSYDITELYDQMQSHFLHTFLLILGGLGLFYVSIRRTFKSFSRSLSDLQQQLEVSKEDNHLEFRLPENQYYLEFTQIAQTVNQMFRRLQTNVDELQEETRKSAALSSELAIAGRIQQNLLLDVSGIRKITDRHQVEIGALLAPAKAVAGDFYCVLPRPDGKLLLAIGDVAGKGAAAALVASECVNLIEMYGPMSPGKLLQKVNGVLFRKFAEQSMFVTLFCCVLDAETGTLVHCSAGHEPPLLYRRADNRIGRLDVEHGMALGFLPDTAYLPTTTYLEKDQILLLYTDGLEGSVEHQDPSLEPLPLGAGLLRNPLLDNVDLQTRLHLIRQSALQEQGGELYDDITMLGVRLEKCRYQTFAIAAERDQAGVAITRLRTLLAEQRASADSCDRLSVILDEWTSNLIKYAQVDSDIIVCLHCSRAGVNMELIASCKSPMDPHEAPEVDIDQYLESGITGKLGVHMIRNLADVMDYDTWESWARLRVRVNREGGNHAPQF